MENRRRMLVRITSIFAVLETIFLYYAMVITITLSNFNYKALFNYLPGIGYIFKIFFPKFWYYVVNNPVYKGPKVLYGIGPYTHFEYFPVIGIAHLLMALWILFLASSVATPIIYFKKIKHVSQKPNIASPQAV